MDTESGLIRLILHASKAPYFGTGGVPRAPVSLDAGNDPSVISADRQAITSSAGSETIPMALKALGISASDICSEPGIAKEIVGSDGNDGHVDKDKERAAESTDSAGRQRSHSSFNGMTTAADRMAYARFAKLAAAAADKALSRHSGLVSFLEESVGAESGGAGAKEERTSVIHHALSFSRNSLVSTLEAALVQRWKQTREVIERESAVVKDDEVFVMLFFLFYFFPVCSLLKKKKKKKLQLTR